MSNFNKYLIFILVLALAIMSSYSLYLKNQRDNVRYKLADTTNQLDQAITTNKEQQTTIVKLNQQSELARQYLQELTLRKQQSEQTIEQLEQQFKRQQHDSESIRNWANQLVPTGLY